ncbi:MAG: energy-coupling factor ABC transporter substrate-binding protein [Anaerovoracaceae bacterium]
MSKNTKIVIACLVIATIIAVIPLTMNLNSEFGGADGKAEEQITKIDKDYKPWFSHILEPPGGETESLLFCLQAALGSGVFFFGLGYLVARKKYKSEEIKEEVKE